MIDGCYITSKDKAQNNRKRHLTHQTLPLFFLFTLKCFFLWTFQYDPSTFSLSLLLPSRPSFHIPPRKKTPHSAAISEIGKQNPMSPFPRPSPLLFLLCRTPSLLTLLTENIEKENKPKYLHKEPTTTLLRKSPTNYFGLHLLAEVE